MAKNGLGSAPFLRGRSGSSNIKAWRGKAGYKEAKALEKKGLSQSAIKKKLKESKGHYVYIPITQKEGSIAFGKKAVREVKAWAKKRQKASDSLAKQFGYDKIKKSKGGLIRKPKLAKRGF